MSSEVQGVRGWLLHLYPDLRQKSAFLKSGYALRSGVGVGLFAICHAVFQHESDRRGGNITLLQWSQGCLWGAITVLTGTLHLHGRHSLWAVHAFGPWRAGLKRLALSAVNFPIMGRIAKQSFERELGTVIGGWLGYAAYIVSQHPSVEAWAECWTAIISFLFAFAAFLIGVKLKLDYSAKLLGITFVLGRVIEEVLFPTCIGALWLLSLLKSSTKPAKTATDVNRLTRSCFHPTLQQDWKPSVKLLTSFAQGVSA